VRITSESVKTTVRKNIDLHPPEAIRGINVFLRSIPSSLLHVSKPVHGFFDGTGNGSNATISLSPLLIFLEIISRRNLTLKSRLWNRFLLALIVVFSFFTQYDDLLAAPAYAWLASTSNETVADIKPPVNARRIDVARGSFAEWLRYLPLKKPGMPVMLFNGEQKRNQEAHFRVVDMSVGRRDLQQCADALIRLRAEYLFSRGEFSRIRFSFTSGDIVPFQRWLNGERPLVKGNRVIWRGGASRAAGHDALMHYLTTLFMYAGSISLHRDTAKVAGSIQPGQILIQAGSPGHAVIVLDVAVDDAGRRFYLLGQSYMPAQEFHVLKNPQSPDFSPWYAEGDDIIPTPEWTFRRQDRRAFHG